MRIDEVALRPGVFVCLCAVLAVGCGQAGLPSQSEQELASCSNPAVPYAVGYPRTWYVVPADDEAGVEPCTYFGPEEFEFTDNHAPMLTGASVVVVAHPSCMGYEFEPDHRRDIQIDGFPAREEEFSKPVAYLQYVVEVRDGDACEQQGVVIVRTDPQAPGDYQENKRVVRVLAMNLDIRPTSLPSHAGF